MKDEVIKIISKATKMDPVYLSENSSAIEWDSLKHLEIIFLVEEAFNVRLNSDDIVNMHSIDAIVEVLYRRCGDKN